MPMEISRIMLANVKNLRKCKSITKPDNIENRSAPAGFVRPAIVVYSMQLASKHAHAMTENVVGRTYKTVSISSNKALQKTIILVCLRILYPLY